MSEGRKMISDDATEQLNTMCLYERKNLHRAIALLFWNVLKIKSMKLRQLQLLPSQQLLVQSQQWKHQNNVWNLFKINNDDTRTTSITSFWGLYCYPKAVFTHRSSVSIVDFKQVNSGWVVLYFPLWKTKKIISMIDTTLKHCLILARSRLILSYLLK